ncbi:hypothetical protein [Actinoplanes aureus]|uniref:Uncharacterized protein n=1 Tax=Actinoplanes aureus TaxID=2792083 RepID=A0A931G0P8_9ACTN|nr:hypothetical protein [Actinoplanes aureus]MBG0566130.1 hypothetical protein [Actinoplanes aureus]
MKILIVSSYCPPHVGGVEVVAQQQAVPVEPDAARERTGPVRELAELGR